MRRFVLWSSRHPQAVVAFAFLVVGLSVLAASRLRIDTDLFSLVPAENPVVAEFKVTLERFGSLDTMVLALELPSRDGLDEAEAEARLESAFRYADLLADEVRALPSVEWLEYRSADLVDAARSFVSWAPLLMDEAGFERLLERVGAEDGMELAAAELAAALRSPADPWPKVWRMADPLGMVPSTLGQIMGEERTSSFDMGSGYWVDGEQTLLLMVLGPTGAPADLPFSKALLADIRASAERAEAAWRAEVEEAGLAALDAPPAVLPAGGHVLAAEDGRLITQDLLLGTAVTLVAVVLLFSFAFGRRSAVLIAFVPLGVGLLATAGLASVTVGKLNGVTAAFGALLLGLGIDFVIVFYGRYLEQRSSGQSHEDALAMCSDHTVPSIVLGAATTAVTFLAFMVSSFAGLWQLGWLTGGGILVVAASVLGLLPALLTLADRASAARASADGGAPERGKRALRAFGTVRLFRWSLAHPQKSLVLNGALSVLLGMAAWGIAYDDDVLNMRSAKNEGAVNQQRIMDAFDLRLTPYIIRIDGESEARAMERAADLATALQPLADGERLSRIDSIVRWIPDFASQTRRVERLQGALAGRGVSPSEVRQELAAALRAQGLRPEIFADGLAQVEQALSVDAPRGLRALKETGVFPWARRYGAFDDVPGASDGAASVALYSYPPAGRRARDVPPELRTAVSEAGAVLTGPVLISAELKDVVWNDAMTAGVVGTFVVFLCLAWSLGGPMRALGALIPLGLGLVWMLGFMSLLDVPMNYLNVFVLTMILGIGVDYGIHLLHRHAERGVEGAVGLAPAVTVAAATTVCGFGSLALSFVPALRSMGVAAIFGVLSVAWLTLTLLPALLVLSGRRS